MQFLNIVSAIAILAGAVSAIPASAPPTLPVSQKTTGAQIKEIFISRIGDLATSMEEQNAILKYTAIMPPVIWDRLSEVENKAFVEIGKANPDQKIIEQAVTAWLFLAGCQVPDFDNLPAETEDLPLCKF
ncbi:hypothetical protein TWF694_007640 [Orbilia ellipsospora]|uniref:Uncharacterized protein n=1 Tax=Orbilia ellipsospora TaxID=2528407 RepID=A0AAV9XIG3_9PEZI